jgi:hypothetical protein
MTTDEILHQLKYQAARFVLDKEDKEEIARLLDELMLQGVYYDEFLAVIDGDDYGPGYKKALTAALHRLEILIPPNIHEAALEIIRHHLNTIVSGISDPINPLKWLMNDIYRNYDFVGAAYVGDKIGLSDLVGAYWTLDEWDAFPPRPEEVDALRVEIKQAAEIWLRDWSNRVPNSK